MPSYKSAKRAPAKLSELRLRNVDPAALAKFEKMAADKDMSRNELIKAILERAAASPEADALDERYHALVQQLLEVLENFTSELDRFSTILERLASTGEDN